MPLPPYKDTQAREAERHLKRENQLPPLPPMKWWWFRQRDAVARFTLYLAFFTVVLGAIGLLQWCTSHAQLTEMGAQRADTEAQERAVLSMVGANAISFNDTGADIKFRQKNSGQTTALHVGLNSNIEIQEIPLDGRVAINPYAAGDIPAPNDSTVYVGTPITGIMNPVFSRGLNLLPAFRRGDSNVAIVWYGTISYQDIFVHRQSSDFCFIFWLAEIHDGGNFQACINHRGTS